MASQSFNFNGTTFYYERLGQGEPVVLLHAGICDRRMWQPQLEPLAEQFEVITYDMRGFGETAVSPTDFSHIDDLLALLDHWQLDRVHLVGGSKGGTVGLDFTLRHPQRVISLAMVCSTPSGFEFVGESPPLWDELVAAFEAGDLEKASRLEVELWVDGWQHRPPPSAPAAIRELVYEMNLQVLHNEKLDGGKERPLTFKAIDRLDQVTVPVLLITGRYDDDEIDRAANEMAIALPNVTKITLNAAHLPNMEQPAQFNHTLLHFLRSVQL